MQTPITPTTTPPDSWQTLSWKAAVFAALFAAIVALAKGVWALLQQRRTFRWQQAELARELMDTCFSWAASHNALRMVDEGAGTYSVEGYGSHTVHPSVDIPQALAVRGLPGSLESASNSEKDNFVRKCFDVLLYCLQRIEHSIDIGVVRREDVRVPAEYYVRQLARFKPSLGPYIDYAGFPGAKRLQTS